MANYSNYSDQDLKDIITSCHNELIRRRDEKIQKLANEALKSGNERIRYIGEALLHQQLKIEPKTKELGYLIARMSKDFPDEFKKIKEKLYQHFDEFDYVMCNTHFDECNNGFYFRRS